jgi:hypothetical protein
MGPKTMTNRRGFLASLVVLVAAPFAPKAPRFVGEWPRHSHHWPIHWVPQRKKMARIRLTEEAIKDAQYTTFLHNQKIKHNNIMLDLIKRTEKDFL